MNLEVNITTKIWLKFCKQGFYPKPTFVMTSVYMIHAWLAMVLKTGQNVGGGAHNSFLVTWSLKGLIQFHEKG